MKLYEFKVKKVYDTGDFREFLYQVPASDEFAAHVELGRIFHGEDYDLVVLDYKKVREK